MAHVVSRERSQGGSVGIEGGDGFDEAGDGEGVADAAVAADEMQRAVFPGQPNGDAHERRNARAVDLRDAIETDDDLACTAPDDRLQGIGELLAGLPDGQAAVDFEHVDSAGFADVNLHWGTLSHGIGFEQLSLTARDQAYQFARSGRGRSKSIDALYDDRSAEQGKHSRNI
jgi:hypothetical protein